MTSLGLLVIDLLEQMVLADLACPCDRRPRVNRLEETRFEPAAHMPFVDEATVQCAYRQSAISAIGRGENGGRTLTEYHIVRAERRLGSYTGEGRKYDVDVASLPKDATDVAVLVQLAGQGAIVAAASHSLL